MTYDTLQGHEVRPGDVLLREDELAATVTGIESGMDDEHGLTVIVSDDAGEEQSWPVNDATPYVRGSQYQGFLEAQEHAERHAKAALEEELLAKAAEADRLATEEKIAAAAAAPIEVQDETDEDAEALPAED